MAATSDEIVQRSFQFCVIDEVDSILIDEARTPLIISGQVERPQEKYQKAAFVVDKLIRSNELSKDGVDPEGDYEVDEKQRSCILTDEGFAKTEKLLKVNDLFDPKDPWAHYVTNALKAKELFEKDKDITGYVDPGLDFMKGSKLSPSKNPNSYPMTDTKLFQSEIEILVNGKLKSETTLIDDPAAVSYTHLTLPTKRIV